MTKDVKQFVKRVDLENQLGRAQIYEYIFLLNYRSVGASEQFIVYH